MQSERICWTPLVDWLSWSAYEIVPVLSGPDAVSELAGYPCDVVLNGVDGAAGLRATLAALRAGRTLVVSDGHPNDPAAALAVADRLSGVIDVLYCGPDGDERAVVEALISATGLRPVRVGDQDAVPIVDTITRLWMALAFQQGWGRGVGFKILTR